MNEEHNATPNEETATTEESSTEPAPSPEEGNKKTAEEKNVAMGVLAYLGPLVIVPFVTAKDDPFVKFHIKQGLVLLVIEVAMWFLASMFWAFWPLFHLINLGVLALIIIGIIRVVQGEEKPLPLVGQFSKHFPI